MVEGTKFPGDLRVERLENGRWLPVFMEEAFLMVDFFCENEEARQPHMPNWRKSGGRYFLDECVDAHRNGWLAPTRRLRSQQRGRAA